MKKLVYIFIVFALTACAHKSNQPSQSSIHDSIPNDTTPTVIVEQEPTEKKEIVLPNPPDWLTPDKLDIVKEWEDDAKLELYTYMDFFNSISSLVSTTTQPNSQNIRTISTDKQHISLHEIFNDTTVYYVAIFTNPPFTDFFFGYQQYTKKDNYLFLAKSNPVIWVDGIDKGNPSCYNELSLKTERIYPTKDGWFFSVETSMANSEFGGYEVKITNERYYSLCNYFFDCNGNEIHYSVIEETSDIRTKDSLISDVNNTIDIEIRQNEFTNGFPDIIEHINIREYYIKDSTPIDSSYIVTYKYNINTLKYEPVGSKDKQ